MSDIKRGETRCATPEAVANLERQIEREKEQRLAQERREQEEKKRAAEEAKFKADAPARKKVSEQLKDTVDLQRQAELAKLAQRQTQQKLQESKAQMQLACSQLKQQAIARGENPATTPGSVTCSSYGFPLGGSSVASGGKGLPQATQFNFAECQLGHLANGADWQSAKSSCDARYLQGVVQGRSGGSGSAVASASAPAALTKEQYDYLKANAAVMQPEQRKVALPLAAPAAALSPSALATFMCGTPPKQYPCPPATIEAYRTKTTVVYSQLGVSPDAILDRLEERHRKGLEYLRDSPEVKAALLSIQAKSAGFAAGGPVGMEIAGNALLAKSAFEGVTEFRQGKHYEGTLRSVNEVSSFAAEKLGLPPGSSDALNLAGAASTAYLYGFFKGL